jgi:hypothetical protein
MITVKIDDTQFMREMNNLMGYSTGFLDGAKIGKPNLLKNLGIELKELVADFIDSNARIDPSSLHHVYEWYQTGSPDARLFDIDYIVTGAGLSMNATLTQSSTNPKGSNVPFYNKAKVMENGIAVTIKPRNVQALAFTQNGEQVFTTKPVTVNNPGGDQVQGSFHEIFKTFFRTYASQSILDISGLAIQLRNPRDFDKNFAAGKSGGRSLGVTVGRRWIAGGVI